MIKGLAMITCLAWSYLDLNVGKDDFQDLEDQRHRYFQTTFLPNFSDMWGTLQMRGRKSKSKSEWKLIQRLILNLKIPAALARLRNTTHVTKISLRIAKLIKIIVILQYFFASYVCIRPSTVHC